jgi:hypothetical protein
MSTSASSRERRCGTRSEFVAALTVLLLVLGLPVGLRAQQSQAGSSGAIEPLDSSCLATFVSGTAEELVRICISKHGNLIKFESPAGFEHIRNGDFDEGYILCRDFTNQVAFDIGDNESGFDDGTVSQPGGPGTLPITVTRNSLDGLFRLTQTFTWDPGSNQVFIEMRVKNVSGAKQFGVGVIRMADFDIGENVTGLFENEWAQTLDSVFAWNDFGSLTGTTAPQALRLSAVTRKTFHFPEVVLVGENSCAPSLEPTPDHDDFAGRMSYSVGTIAQNATKTVRFAYRRY